MPLHRWRALEAAILDSLWWQVDARGRRTSRAHSHGSERINVRQTARHVVHAFQSLGIRVSERSVLAAYYDRTPLPYDPRRADMPASIRHAADMLNLRGSSGLRNALIDAIYLWAVAEVRAGRMVPLEAWALAVAYRESRAEMCATK